MKRERTIVMVLSVCFMVDFVLQLFPSDVYVSPERKALHLAQDILLMVALVGVVVLTIRILKASGGGSWTVLAVLGWIAGTGVLLMDLSAHLEKKQRMKTADLGAALSHYDSGSQYLNRSRWMQVCGDTSQHDHITRADLQFFESVSRGPLEAIDEVLPQLPASEQEPWRVRRALLTACSEQGKLFVANWGQWQASGFKLTQDEVKSWQKEAMRLQGEIEALRKEDRALSPKVDEAFEKWKSENPED